MTLAEKWATLPNWVRRLLYGLDVLAGQALGERYRSFQGRPCATISERLARSRGRGETMGILGCRLLDRYDRGHCDRAIPPEED